MTKKRKKDLLGELENKLLKHPFKDELFLCNLVDYYLPIRDEEAQWLLDLIWENRPRRIKHPRCSRVQFWRGDDLKSRLKFIKKLKSKI